MYKLHILRQAVKDLAAISPPYSRQISQKIEALASDPRPDGVAKLSGHLGYRVRSGNYRILYLINDEAKTVTIYRVRHRREAYR